LKYPTNSEASVDLDVVSEILEDNEMDIHANEESACSPF